MIVKRRKLVLVEEKIETEASFDEIIHNYCSPKHEKCTNGDEQTKDFINCEELHWAQSDLV